MSLLETLIPLTLGFTSHHLLNTILRHTLPLPFSHKKIQTPSLQKKKYNAYLSNYTCMLHAISMTLYGLYTIITFNYNTKRKMTKIDKNFLLFSLSYYIYDNIYEYWAGLYNSKIFVHHLVMIFVNLYSLVYDKNACLLGIVYFVGELSNPLLCLHQNIGCYEHYKGLSEILGVIFCFVFLVNRVFVSTYYLFLWNLDSEIGYFFVFIFSFGFFVSYQWSFETFNKLVKLLRNFRSGNNDSGDDFYKVTSSLRYNKRFIFYYQVFLVSLCFGPLLLFRHDNWF